MLLTKGGHNFLVLSSFGCLVDPFFPREPFLLIGVFQSLDNFQVLYVDRVFRLDAYDPGFCPRSLSDGTFQFDPIDPNGRRGAVAVLTFVGVEFSAEGLLVAFGSAFLNAEFALRLRADHKRGLDDLRVVFRACDLKAGKWLAGETGGDLVDALRMPHLDEVPGGG